MLLGYVSVDIGSVTFPAGSFYPSGPSSINPGIIRITFTRTMNDSSYKSTASIEQIYAEINVREFDVMMGLYDKQQTYFDIEVYSSMINKVRSMTFRWMIIDSTWGTFAGYYMYMSTPFEYVHNTRSYTWNKYSLDPVNMTGTVQIFAVLTGFTIRSYSSTVLDLSLKLSSITRTTSTSHYGVLTSDSTSSVYLDYFTYSEMAFNLG